MADFAYTPEVLAESADVPASVADRELSTWGLDADWLGKHPIEMGEAFVREKTFWRIQVDVTYRYTQKVAGDKVYPPVEFRTYLYTVGQPPDDLLSHFREFDNPRLQHLFNSGPYGEGGYGGGYMFGYRFFERTVAIENEEVSAQEAELLGVPQYEVNLRADATSRDVADVVGESGGRFDPFMLAERGPEEEVWNVTFNPSRGQRGVYEFRPQGAARKRVEGMQKEVYLNGHYIGNTHPTRGTVELNKYYTSNDQTWKNSTTGKQMWSKRKFLNETQMSPQAIRKGGQVYKIEETEDAMFFVATKDQLPDDFDPTPEEVLPSDPNELITMIFHPDCTTFYIEYDRGPRMGRYDAPTVKQSCEEETLTYQ